MADVIIKDPGGGGPERDPINHLFLLFVLAILVIGGLYAIGRGVRSPAPDAPAPPAVSP